MKIGYFADGSWAHKAFEKIIKDNTIQIVFITVRYDKKDKVLLDFAHRYNIPVELSENINSQAFINTVEKYNAGTAMRIYLYQCHLIKYLRMK